MNDKYVNKLIKCHNKVIGQANMPDHLLITDISGGLVSTVKKALNVINGDKAYNDPVDYVRDARIVDYVVYNASRMFSMRSDMIKYFKYNQIFGNKGLDMFLESPAGARFFERRFLKSICISKSELVNFICDKDKHPLRRYVYVKSEDRAKRRLHNSRAGFLICQNSTTLYTPLSPVCMSCVYKDECEANLYKLNSELYRLRKE